MRKFQEEKSFLQQWQIYWKKSVESPQKVQVLLLISHIQVLLLTCHCKRLELLTHELSNDLALTVHQLEEIQRKYYYAPNNYAPNDDDSIDDEY
jgi:hypothetical protein